MAGWKDLLALIREGLDAQAIMDRLHLPPSRLQRLVESRRLREALDAEAELAAALARHRTAGAVDRTAKRLHELAASEKDETARRVCEALLAEGLRGGSEEAELLDALSLEDMVRLEKLPSWVVREYGREPRERKREVIRAGLLQFRRKRLRQLGA
jgi:hypothetical protein